MLNLKLIRSYVAISTSLFLSINNIYASSGDSVMIAPTSTAVPSMSYQSAVKSSGNTYSYTYVTQYQTSVCPSSLTANGSSIYNSAQRQIISTYLGSQLVSTQTTSWTDIDTDCSGKQTQNLSCPVGYAGTITQQRKVGTASNGDGSLQYDPWITKNNSCYRNDVQVLACPSGYNGNITQQRQITMNIDGSYNIGGWVTTTNTCVPARVCQYSFNVSYVVYWSGLSTWMNWNGDFQQLITIISFNIF